MRCRVIGDEVTTNLKEPPTALWLSVGTTRGRHRDSPPRDDSPREPGRLVVDPRSAIERGERGDKLGIAGCEDLVALVPKARERGIALIDDRVRVGRDRSLAVLEADGRRSCDGV